MDNLFTISISTEATILRDTCVQCVCDVIYTGELFAWLKALAYLCEVMEDESFDFSQTPT